MGKWILASFALFLLVLLPGCTLPQMPWDQPKPPPAPLPIVPVPENPVEEVSEAALAYLNLSAAAQKQYVISYNATVSEMGRVKKAFKATLYAKGEFSQRTDILTMNDDSLDEIRQYYTGGGEFLCIRLKGKALKCSSAEPNEQAEGYLQEVVRPIIDAEGLAKYEIAQLPNRTILRGNASCFSLNESGGASSLTHCLWKNGLLVYGRETDDAGKAREMIGISARLSASDKDFELPVKVEEEQEEEDTFENIVPRNISDRISDGQFRIVDQGAFPLKIYAISSGLSDAVLVTKGEFAMLLDAGDFGKADAFLRHLGIRRINVLVATRDYQGAVAGLPQILDSYPVDEFWENGVAPLSESLKSALLKVYEKGIVVKRPQAGDSMGFSGINFTALNPSKSRMLNNPDLDSIVLKVSMGDFCALLLNPTVQERENALISTGIGLGCDVATYFKHGEGRPEPSVLISNVNPRDVVISVGNNSLGLPRGTTLTRLNISGTRVWRTDERGTVRITNDGFSPYQVAGMKNFTSKRWTDYYGMNVS